MNTESPLERIIPVNFLEGGRLPSVTGQTFDVSPLSFGVEGACGERTFAGAADTGEADQLIACQNEIDVLQMMFPCAFDDDVGYTVIIPYNFACVLAGTPRPLR